VAENSRRSLVNYNVHEKDTDTFERLVYKYACYFNFTPICTSTLIPKFNERHVIYQKNRHPVDGFNLFVEFSFMKHHVYLTCVYNLQF
jgi:hypothetical protein